MILGRFLASIDRFLHKRSRPSPRLARGKKSSQNGRVLAEIESRGFRGSRPLIPQASAGSRSACDCRAARRWRTTSRRATRSSPSDVSLSSSGSREPPRAAPHAVDAPPPPGRPRVPRDQRLYVQVQALGDPQAPPVAQRARRPGRRRRYSRRHRTSTRQGRPRGERRGRGR